MSHIEKEFKNLLTQQQYEQLKVDFHSTFTRQLTQTNSYFDHDGQLEAAHCALRVRLVEGQENGELTLKIPQDSFEVLEITEEFPQSQLEWWIESEGFVLPTVLQEALLDLGIDLVSVQLTTTLTTTRLEGNLTPDQLLVLDYSRYSDQEDYELELEVSDLTTGETLFNEILEKYDIKRQQSPSKIRRALLAQRKKIS